MRTRYEEIPPEFLRHRKTPVTFNGNDLRNKEFPPITWAIPDVLPAGVTLFGGREKMGKSWLAFSLCVAVATGGYALGKMPVEQGDALYLSLEDPERRLNKRIRRLAREDTDLAHFHYTTEWNAADRGGVDDLGDWLEEHPDSRLVVIDTLKRIRPTTAGKRNMYDEDYEAVQPFVKLAAEHNAAVVIVHHLNQLSEPQDPFDAFSGSSGLTAAAEHIWLLTRKRGDADAYLMIDGKDIEDPQELALGWDAETCTWTAQGDAATYRLNKERREIVELLEREDRPMGPKEVADTLGKDRTAIRQMMSRMHNDGQLRQEGYGKYVTASGPGTRHSSHTSHTSGLSGGCHSSHTSHTSDQGPLSMGDSNNSQESHFGRESHTSHTSVTGVTGVTGPQEELSTDLPDYAAMWKERSRELAGGEACHHGTPDGCWLCRREIERLIAEGMAPEFARAEVLK